MHVERSLCSCDACIAGLAVNVKYCDEKLRIKAKRKIATSEEVWSNFVVALAGFR